MHWGALQKNVQKGAPCSLGCRKLILINYLVGPLSSYYGPARSTGRRKNKKEMDDGRTYPTSYM